MLIEYHGEYDGGGGAPVCPGPRTPGWFDLNCYEQTNGTVPPWFYGHVFCSCQDSTNNTYACVRTLNATHNFVYCEFVEGLVEAYSLDADPWQQTNLGPTLSPQDKDYWHTKLQALQTCTGPSCGRSTPTGANPPQLHRPRGTPWLPLFPDTQ